MNAVEKSYYLNNLTKRGVKLRVNNFDAGYYIGSTLVAKVQLGIWSLPSLTSTLIRTIKPGGYVGTIDSYIVKGSDVWWQLQGGGYVLHGPGKFDLNTAATTASGKQFADDQAKAAEADVIGNAAGKLATGLGNVVGGAGDLLSSLGKNLPLYIVAALVGLFLVVKVVK